MTYLTDDEGSITKTYEYDAFGNEEDPAATDTNPFRYAGEYYDKETGTYTSGPDTTILSSDALPRKTPRGTARTGTCTAIAILSGVLILVETFRLILF